MRWLNVSAPPLSGEAGHLAPADGDGAELNGSEPERFGNVVVVQRRRAAVALVAPGRDAQGGGHGVELLGIVG